ncbi:MAG: hypothetical protein JKY96_05320, partial [Phycisphaerales bacterium]|nr:hypothetical protein [Phycisphaerales bacterium]
MQVGPDISVSFAGAQIPASDGSPRAMLDWGRSVGARGVVLDGARAGFRAREIGRSARRDLAASMRRREIEIAGIDLWIPAEHFALPEHCGRAVEVVIQTCVLASELASLVGGRSVGRVSVMTPASIDADVLREMGDGAAMVGAEIVDHRVGNEG